VKTVSRPLPSASITQPSEPQRGIVQLPIDFLRGTSAARAHTLATPRVLFDLSSPQTAPLRASLVAGVVALLGRYAQQGELTLDLSLCSGGFAEAARAAVDFSLDDQQTFASLTQTAASVLGELPGGAGVGSNVALTFLCGDPQLAGRGLKEAHDLHFVLHEADGRVVLRVVYDAMLFRKQSIDRLLDSLELLLSAALREPERALYELPVLTSKHAAALEAACDGGSSCEPEQPFLTDFERCVRAHPTACAVSHRGSDLSYGELDRRAEQLANHLVSAGVRAEAPIAVCLPPSIDVLVALLAIFKAGGVYVPLDPTHPRALLHTIVEDAQPALLLTDTRVQPDVLPEALPRVLLDRDWPEVERAPARAQLGQRCLDAACYVLYTSGTTGRPKGVVATARNLAHYLRAARQRYGFSAADVFCSLARYTFSISLFELLSPLSCGGRVILLDRDDVLDPLRLLSALERVTVLHAGPALLGSLFRHLRGTGSGLRTLPNVRHASSGGDLVAPQILEDMKQVFCAAEIFVIYGCTEIACMGCTLPVGRGQRATRHLVGRPFTDVLVRVLDAHGNLVPFGVVGEIHFAGRGLARRYLNQPELSSDKFVCIGGRRFYKTGDLGRVSADGELEILGRRDFQVQLRGIRIELAGIEHTVRELGLATQVSVIAAAREQHDVRLIAYVVNPSVHDAAGFRAALAARLPEYMVPQTVIELDALPLTPNGKLDRLGLAALARAPRPTKRGRGEIATARERAIAESYASVLGLPEVAVDDDFFALGGHSLSAVLLLAQLRERHGLTVSPSLLFAHSSVRALARASENCAPAEEPEQSLPVLLSRRADRPALFMVLGVHLYRELARALEGRYAVYGVFAGSEVESLDHTARTPLAGTPSVSALARQYIALIRRVQPVGPYRIGGMSFGGIVAYEVAQQLEDDGEQVESLLLIDAVLPEPPLHKLRRLLALPLRVLCGELLQRMRAVASGALRQRVLGASPSDTDAQLRSLDQRRQAGYRAATLRYMEKIRPYHGRVALAVAQKRLDEGLLEDPACGLARLVTHLRVQPVQAHHLELLAAPAVVEVAGLLSDEAEPAPRPARFMRPTRAPRRSLPALS
jgi:amino acid adenylation domain-containing protein